MKTYAQALGMNKLQKENESNDNSKNEKDKKQPKDKKMNNNIRKVIKSMEKQMMQLKEMIVLVCGTIRQDEVIKKTIKSKMNKIENSIINGEEDEEVTILYEQNK